MTATRKLYEVLDVFKVEGKKEALFDIFVNLLKNERKWRVREAIADQMGFLCQVYNSENIARYIMPTAFSLCNDRVAIVRNKAASKISQILETFIPGLEDEEDPVCAGHRQIIIEMIRGYAASPNSTQRLVFVRILEEVVRYEPLFLAHFNDLLDKLAQDPVPAVRIGLALLLARKLPGASDRLRPLLEVTAARMREDPEPVVREQLASLP